LNQLGFQRIILVLQPAASDAQWPLLINSHASSNGFSDVEERPENTNERWRIKTVLCDMLGIEYPIIAAPMGPDLTGPESVAAVSNAGGLGILQAQFCAPPRFRAEIHRVRALTDKPLGVNLLLHFPIEEQVTISESRAHPHYKQKVLEASEADTVRTILFGYGWPNAPRRTLRTEFVRQWLGQEGRGQESRPDEPVVGQTVLGGQPMPVLRFMGFPPNSSATGDIDSMDLLMGQNAGLVREIVPAGHIVRELVEEARQIISQRLAQLIAATQKES
jgi:NAD(P)H-dependent flavin oxidoreductase YrpB (nitropropane dioxygenase family)